MQKDARFTGGPDGETPFDFTLPDCKIYYPSLFTPDTKYESVWKVDIVLNESLAASMKAVGFNVKTKVFDEKEGEVYYIRAKRKTHTRKGKALYPPRVYDAGTPTSKPQLWPEDVMIGNGTIANIKVSAIYREVNGSTSLPLYLNGVQIVDLVSYGGSMFDSVGSGQDVPF